MTAFLQFSHIRHLGTVWICLLRHKQGHVNILSRMVVISAKLYFGHYFKIKGLLAICYFVTWFYIAYPNLHYIETTRNAV
jgi:hypothetical protein